MRGAFDRAVLRGAVVVVLGCGGPGTPVLVANHATDTTPLLVATSRYPSGLVVAAVGERGVHVLGETPHTDELGWLDEHTLIGLDDMGMDDIGLAITRTVDGRHVETIEVPKSEWSGSSSLYLSRARAEVWVGRCEKIAEDTMGECLQYDVMRVLPAPRIHTRQIPKTDVQTTSSYIGSGTWPLAPTMSGLAGVRLTKVTEHVGGVREVDGVACERDGVRITYPDFEDWDISGSLRVDGIRWVSRTPPIYEVQLRVINPVDLEEEHRYYFRPCSEAPMDNFAWLGNGRWAEFHEVVERTQRSPLGQWTFYDGTRELGRLDGLDDLRANRFEP